MGIFPQKLPIAPLLFSPQANKIESTEQGSVCMESLTVWLAETRKIKQAASMHNINTFEKVSQNFHYKNHTKAIF
jgi:hypothetical protein